MSGDCAHVPQAHSDSDDTIASLARRLEQELPDLEEITVGAFLPMLGVNGFSFFILILGILNIAIFLLPGLSILFGIPMIVMAAQMLTGHQSPVFPEYVTKQKIKISVLHAGLDFAVRALEKLEKGVKPRLTVLTHPSFRHAHAFFALLLACMVAIPIPLMNIPPTLGVVLLMLGRMQRDGYFVAGAYVFGFWSLWLYESLGQAAHHLLG